MKVYWCDPPNNICYLDDFMNDIACSLDYYLIKRTLIIENYFFCLFNDKSYRFCFIANSKLVFLIVTSIFPLIPCLLILIFIIIFSPPSRHIIVISLRLSLLWLLLLKLLLAYELNHEKVFGKIF